MYARRVLLLLLLSTVGAVGQQTEQPYRNPATPMEARVKDLVGRMTLEEKVAQMRSTWQNLANGQDPATYVFDTNGNVDEAKAREFLKGGLGQFSRPSEGRKPAQMADVTNRLQKIAIENTRLHIPLMFHDECLHGHVAPGGTVYPQAIAL